MKITIIGANSYIARNFVYYVRREYDEATELFLYDFQQEQIDGFSSYEQIDFKSELSLAKINFKADLIYVFTGKTGALAGMQEFDLFLDINERSLLALLKSYIANEGTGKIIFPSTRLVYKGCKGMLKEDSEKEFKTVYAMNKFACENYLAMYANVYGVPYVVFRICVPYGTMIPNASSYGTAEFLVGKGSRGEDITLYGDGSQRRTLINMVDLCNMLYLGGRSEACISDVFNIGGEDYCLKDMANLVANKYNVSVVNIPWPEKELLIESGDTVFDSSKLDNILKETYKVKFYDWVNEK